MKMEQTECSETSAYKIQTPGNHPEENIQQAGQLLTSTSRLYQTSDYGTFQYPGRAIRQAAIAGLSSCSLVQVGFVVHKMNL